MPISNPSLPTVPAGLHVEGLTLDAAGLVITARTIAAEATCPVCGHASARVHGRHWRTFHDLPWQDRAVTWRVLVRRFRCCRCPGRTFAEPVPGLPGAKARRTGRLAEAQADIGMALGGEAGARLSRRLAMPVSGDTVLRLVRRRPLPPCPSPRVVGIDDWAWLRGRRYGTVICDLERRRVVDLLPGRSAAPVREWLAAHPGIAVVSRDRAGPYAEAARTGAPGAVQVADRWHLLVNASEALRGVVERHQAQIQDAARRRASPVPTPPAPAKAPAASVRGHQRRARFETVLRLRAEGLPMKEIARRAGVARNAVRRWLRAGEFVPYRRAPAPGLLDPHLPFVEERWRAGLRNSVELHRELGARGFEGGYDIVRRWAAQRRRGQDAASRPPSSRVPSTRRTTRLLTGDPASLFPDDRAFVGALLASAPEIRVAAEHVRAFADLMRRREPAAFDAWLDTATATGLGGFVAGLRQDRDAVRAAVAEPWSNGPAEGHINRLKLVKRQMFGRASFDLLRRRVLHAA